MPTEVSPLPWAVRAVPAALVMSWNRVVLPLEANPMRAARSMVNLTGQVGQVGQEGQVVQAEKAGQVDSVGEADGQEWWCGDGRDTERAHGQDRNDQQSGH